MNVIPLHQHNLENRACMVWTRAKEARECARANLRSSAVIRMEELYGFRTDKYPSLNRIVEAALADVHRIMVESYVSAHTGSIS